MTGDSSSADTRAELQRGHAAPWIIDGVLVHVDDMAAYFERAREAGATMLSGIESGRAAVSSTAPMSQLRRTGLYLWTRTQEEP